MVKEIRHRTRKAGVGVWSDDIKPFLLTGTDLAAQVIEPTAVYLRLV